MSETLAKLTRGSLLFRNTIFNFLGQGVPFLVAIFTIPFIIKGLGTERFGVLSLIWLLMSYLSLFDVGLGRALIQMVSSKLGSDQAEGIPTVVWTSLFLMLILGLIGSLILGLLVPWVVKRALTIPKILQDETIKAFYLLAFSLPIVISTPSMQGLLEAYQRFDLTNALKSIMGTYMFLAPLMVLQFSKDLSLVVAVLLIGRLIACVVNFILVLHVIPNLWQKIKFQASTIRLLLRFCSWMTVSNIIGPLMVFLDRFLIGAFISMAAVAYYATPFDVVSKLWLVPNALVGVLFPAMSASFIKDQTRTAELFLRGVKYIFVILFPISLLIVTLAPEGLQFWLGTEFSQHSFRVLQLIALGVLINSVAFVPGSLLQGAGRPDLTGKLHLAELPLYLLVVCYFIKKFGIEGAALAWVLRVTLDAIVLFFLAYRLLISNKVFTLRQSAITIGVALIPLTLALFLTGPLLMKCLFLVFTLMTFLFFAWFVILTPKECLQLARSFKTLPGTWSGHNFDESRK